MRRQMCSSFVSQMTVVVSVYFSEQQKHKVHCNPIIICGNTNHPLYVNKTRLPLGSHEAGHKHVYTHTRARAHTSKLFRFCLEFDLLKVNHIVRDTFLNESLLFQLLFCIVSKLLTRPVTVTCISQNFTQISILIINIFLYEF